MTQADGKVRVLLLTMYFAPDITANAEILTRLAEGLVALGHEVTVITTFPHYDQNRIWEAYRHKLIQRDQTGATPVYRTYLYVPQDKVNLLGRMLSYLSFNVLSCVAGLRAGRHDVILAPSPPLTIGLTAYFLSRIRRVPYVYNVQDIYPDIAVRLGVLTNPAAIRFFGRLEAFVYRKAAAVTVLSEGFNRNLLNKGVPSEKLRVIPNFVDVDYVRPLPKDNPFARRHNLQDRFVVMYAGNVGLSQGLETLLDAAARLRDLPDLRILIVGNGAAKQSLEARTQAQGLTNVSFLPFQPREDIAAMYATADVSLVLIKTGIGADSMPSKVYTIMASGRPVIAAVDDESETRNLIVEAQCGMAIPPEDPQALTDALRLLYGNASLRETQGRNGREHVAKNCTPQIAALRYDALFRTLADSEHRQDQPA